eukprot:COSAG03_NODE_15997_length_414_cov_1.304762_1_plen_43_part_10
MPATSHPFTMLVSMFSCIACTLSIVSAVDARASATYTDTTSVH